MSHFFSRYFAIFISGAAFSLTGIGAAAADGDFYLLNYENAATSPRARMVVFSERLKRLTRQCLSGRRSRNRREIYAMLSDGRKHKPFTYLIDKRGNMRIILPDSYDKLWTEPGALPRLTGWYLFGSSGKDPELEKHFRNSWFVVGLSRKAMGEMNPVQTPFSGYFPAAYVLTSASRYPTLHSLLVTPLPPEDTTLRLIYEEYCELLVMICARNGLFKAGVLSRLLDDLEKSPKRQDMPELFRAYSRPVLEKRASKIFKKITNKAELEKAYETWFRKELDGMLNYNFLPGSAAKLERLYLKTVRFEGRLKPEDQPMAADETVGPKAEEKRSGARVQGGLTELTACFDKLENREKTAAVMIRGLVPLIQMAPPDLKIPLSMVKDSLRIYLSQPTKSNGAALLRSEQNFFRALEKHLALDRFLSETEVACVSPAARYYLTFSVIDYRKAPAQVPLRSLAELLKRTDREYEK